MPLDIKQYTKLLNKYAEELDIPPSKYYEAVKRYESVGALLNYDQYEGCEGKEPIIYPQGSFRLGTVVRPVRNSEEGDYDIDLVCELSVNKSNIQPKQVKVLIGDRIKSNKTYEIMLDKEEGRRCWTLNYAEQDEIGFHLDVLPAISDYNNDNTIAITHKDGVFYSWSASNPNDYATWFKEKNYYAYLLIERPQKTAISTRYPSIYSSIESVPDQLVKTPLQQAIQIMKRHRDLMFDGTEFSKYRPISMIITTLAAHLYDGEAEVYSALKNIIKRLEAHMSLLEEGIVSDEMLAKRGIIRRYNKNWYIPNPVNSDENFADRWHENDNLRAKLFFSWASQISQDLIEIIGSYDRKKVRGSLVSGLGADFVNKNFEAIWPLSMPKPSLSPKAVSISHGQKPWKSINNDSI